MSSVVQSGLNVMLSFDDFFSPDYPLSSNLMTDNKIVISNQHFRKHPFHFSFNTFMVLFQGQ